MWFNRKPKNRRLAREHVLDVKLRSSQARAARMRLAAVALGVTFGTVFALYLIWRTGEWALNVFIYDNKAFAIHQIEIQTDGVVAVDQLRRWAGVKPGQNLLALDLARVKRDLELAPIVEAASVERVLPHTLCIRVVEREPIAQVNVPRRNAAGGIDIAAVHLDVSGCVIPPLELRQRAAAAPPQSDQLPLICGVNPNEVQAGRRIESTQLQAALQLIIAFDHSSMAGLVDLKRIDISSPEILTVTTGQGSEITFGLLDMERQLRRWHDIFDMGQKMSKVVSTLDLAVTNNIPARWLEASAVPPVTPKAPKILRAKKRHV